MHSRLLVALVAGTVALNAVVAVLVVQPLQQSRSDKEKEVLLNAKSVSILIDKAIASTVQTIDMSLRNIADNLETISGSTGKLSPVQVNALLARQHERTSNTQEFRVTDSQGWVRYGPEVDFNEPLSLAGREYFSQHRSSAADQLIIGAPVFGLFQKEWLITFSRRYKGVGGKFEGVIVSSTPVSAFQKLLDDIAIGPHGVAVLRDAQGGLIARNPKSDGAKIGSKIFSKEFRQAMTDKVETAEFHTYESSGDTERMIAFRRLTYGPMFLAVGSGAQDYLVPWHRDVANAVAFELVFLPATVLAAWLFWRLFNNTDRARQRSQLLLRNAHDGIHILSAEGLLLEANDTFLEMLGYGREVIGKFHVSDWDANHLKLKSPSQIYLTTRRVFETRHRRADGTVFPVEVGLSGIEWDGELMIYGASRDISERLKLEFEQRIAAIAFESQEGMMVLDPNGIILRVNKAFCSISGYDAQEVVGQPTDMFGSSRQNLDELPWSRKNLLRKHYWQGEIWSRRKDGRDALHWVTITAVLNDDGTIGNYVGTITDVTDRRAAEEEIKKLAFYDPLTHLPNRPLFAERLWRAISAASRSGNAGGVLFIDIDNFKSLNDSHGHDMGDLLLKQVADRLSQSVRQHDTVARFGGDEFVVLLPELSSDQLVAATLLKQVGQKMLDILDQPFELDGRNHHYTASIGATLYDASGVSVEDLLKRADLAMYESKSAGRNRLRFFDPEMQAAVNERVEMEARLRKGLAHNEFILHFQPQFNSAGNVIGAEALVRWMSPERGMIPPGQFIPLAESNGQIVPLGNCVLEMACAQLAQWSKRPELASIGVSVNISAKQLQLPDFVDQVSAALAKHSLNPSSLELELTESLFVNNVDEIIQKMDALQRIGVKFSLDDFGTGYSSLIYLKRLPLNQLKIDQGFVRDIMSDPNDAAITRTIIALAHNLGLEVMAEGVETQEQLNFLIQNKCRKFQGYLFSRPLPAPEFEHFVAGRIPAATGPA